MKMLDRWLVRRSDRGLMIGSAVLSGMVDYSGLVHLDFRGRSPLGSVPNSPSTTTRRRRWRRRLVRVVLTSTTVVVQCEVVFTSIECSAESSSRRCQRVLHHLNMFARVGHKHSSTTVVTCRCSKPVGPGGGHVGRKGSRLPWLQGLSGPPS